MKPMARLAGRGVICAAILLTGSCGHAREIQSMTYVTAVGLDYEDGKFTAYTQVLNFSNIARTENIELGKRVPIWVGIGRGTTLAGALTDASANAQFPVFWGHLRAILVTERILDKGVKEIYLTLNRYRDIRYNVFVYGTKDRLADLLTQTSIFNLSPLDTIMFTGAQQESPQSFLLPATGNRLIAQINEPGNPAMIPTLTTSDRNWMEDKNKRKMLEISGTYFIRSDRVKDWMSRDELKGARWKERKLERIPLLVPMGGGSNAVVTMKRPKMKIKLAFANGEPVFDLSLRVNGTIFESLDTPIAALNRRAEAEIAAEIRRTYLAALAKQCDPFGLEETLYRGKPAVFRQLGKNGDFFLNARSLRHISVKVDVTSTGKYKGIIH